MDDETSSRVAEHMASVTGRSTKDCRDDVLRLQDVQEPLFEWLQKRPLHRAQFLARPLAVLRQFDGIDRDLLIRLERYQRRTRSTPLGRSFVNVITADVADSHSSIIQADEDDHV